MSTDRDLLSNQLYATAAGLAVCTEIQQRYVIFPVDFIRWALHLIPRQGNEWVTHTSHGSRYSFKFIAERLSENPRQFTVSAMPHEMRHKRQRSSGAFAFDRAATVFPQPVGPVDVPPAKLVRCSAGFGPTRPPMLLLSSHTTLLDLVREVEG